MDKEETSNEKNVDKEKYGVNIVSALTKEAVAYIGRKIGSFKRIPSTLVLIAIIPGIMVFLFTLYIHVSEMSSNYLLTITYRILIVLTGGLVAGTIIILVSTWKKHIYWSKMAYLSLLDIVDQMNKRDEVMARNIEDYVAFMSMFLVTMSVATYIILIAFWALVGEARFFSLILMLTNNAAIAFLAYTLYYILKKEFRYDHAVLSTAFKLFGDKKFKTYNPYINLKNMLILVIATLGIASYYWLYKVIELYNKHGEVYNEAETNLSVSLLKLI